MSVPVPTDLLIAGRYRVFAEIGRGAMGAVWLVEHVHTGDQLALKVGDAVVVVVKATDVMIGK